MKKHKFSIMNDKKTKIHDEIYKQVQKEIVQVLIDNPAPKGADNQLHILGIAVSLTIQLALFSEESRRGEIK